MRALKIIILIYYLFPCICQAQSRGDNEFNYQGHSYSVFIIKVDTNSIKKFRLLQNLAGITHNDFIRPYVNNDPNIFITNATVWDSVYHPLGLFVSEGKTINALNLSDGNQMGFYLKPNGVFLINDKGLSIVESSRTSDFSNIRLAVQSGPMLVIDGRIHDKFDPNSKNRNLRCGVGTFTDNGAAYVVFAVSNEPVTLYEFASLFKNNYKCANALCLQSAGCVMQLPFIKSNGAMNNSPIGNYIMYSNHN
jgi:uncharacterized protein YigE (DUF2233 family)